MHYGHICIIMLNGSDNVLQTTSYHDDSYNRSPDEPQITRLLLSIPTSEKKTWTVTIWIIMGSCVIFKTFKQTKKFYFTLNVYKQSLCLADGPVPSTDTIEIAGSFLFSCISRQFSTYLLHWRATRIMNCLDILTHLFKWRKYHYDKHVLRISVSARVRYILSEYVEEKSRMFKAVIKTTKMDKIIT